MNFKKYFALGILVLSLLIGCKEVGQAIALKPSLIEQIIGPPEIKEDTISIGTFNIQTFGQKKRNNENIMKKLADIVDDYDIIAIQEFRDKELQTIPYFLEKIGKNYSVIASPRIGRTSAKERYAFYYDTNKIEFLNISYVYPDINDIFEREPFIAYFKAKQGNFDFFLVNIHTQPKNATKEINNLVDVFQHVQIKYPDEKDIIILGDFNADGSYYDEKADYDLKNKQYFHAIPDSFDTTVAKSDNTYDRILFLRKHTLSDFAKTSGVDRFQQRWPLTYEEEKKISDHYPVWSLFYINRDQD